MKFLNLKPRGIFLTISVLYILGYVAHALYLQKTVYGDGVYYYAWLMLHPSKYAIGPALFWAPTYLLTHNQFAVGFTGVLATIFSLILLWELLLTKFNKTVSLMSVVAVAGASNLLFYGSLDTVNSHALGFFAATVFLTLLIKRRSWFAVGFFLGVLGLMRTQDLVYGILLIPHLRKHNVLYMASGFFTAFFPQLIAWHYTTGTFWKSPYLLREGFNVFQPHIVGVLFHPQNGLFLWTPITLIGAVGLLVKKYYWFLAVFLLELFLVASWSTWWQGASYSGRMFVSSLPLLTFGTASVFSRLTRFRWTQAYFLLTIVGPLSILNGLSIIYFLLLLH